MKKSVVVTGLGAVTAVGHDVPTTWAALLAGSSGIGLTSLIDTDPFNVKVSAEVKGFTPADHFSPKDARRFDRFVQFSLVATHEAVEDAELALDTISPERVGVYIGSAFGGIATLQKQMDSFNKNARRRVNPFLIPMMIQSMAACQVTIALGFKGPSMSPMTACAAGADAIGQAAEVIQRGDADIMICGGGEAPLVPIVMAGFEAMGVLAAGNGVPSEACRPFDADRNGCVVGEGASILVLESIEHAQRRDAHIYAELVGYGATSDAFHISTPEENGEGVARSMDLAVKKAGLPPNSVDYINAHGTGTIPNDLIETKAIKTVFGEHAYNLAVSSTKASTGHLIGAAGAVEAVATVKALETQTIPPTLNCTLPDPECDLDYVPGQARRAHLEIALSNSIGFGGHNTTLVFRRWKLADESE